MDNKKLKFKANIDSTTFEVLNSEFTRAKAYIMYVGENRNGSAMSKEVVEKALPSLYNVPIVAEFIEKKEDFGTHGGKIIISDEGIEFLQTTKAFGLVAESCNARWEMVEDKEYLVADVILWSGRNPELATTINEFSNQSMEINVFEGEFTEDKTCYNINSFEFSALCLLGRDVEPCFEQAKVVAYSLDDIKSEMDEMFKAYKEFTVNTSMPKTDPITEPTEPKKSFSATYRQKREALQNALAPIIVTDDEGEEIEETYYWISDFDDEYCYVERSYYSQEDSNYDYGRFTYTFDKTTLTATITSEFELMIMVWLTPEENQKIQDERTQMTADFEILQSQIAGYEATITELNAYKATKETAEKQEQVDVIIEGFEADLADNEEFKTIKSTAMDMEIKALEDALFALVGRLKHKPNFNANKPKKVVSVVREGGENTDAPYGKYTPRK